MERAIIQGILKVVANMNARASVGEMDDDMAVPSSAVSVDAVLEKKVASISELSMATRVTVPRARLKMFHALKKASLMICFQCAL